MSEIAEAGAPPLTAERARQILRQVSSFLADNLDHHCRCNACYVCAATFLVKLQDRLIGPTISVSGWRIGMNKTGVGKILHDAGLSIVDSHRTANLILESFHRNDDDRDMFNKGEPLRIQVAEGIHRDELIANLREFGVMAE